MRENSGSIAVQATEVATHRQRCRELPPLQAGEAERLTAAFLANNSITVCPTRYAAPIESISRYSRQTAGSL
jgi:hypothetical protein